MLNKRVTSNQCSIDKSSRGISRRGFLKKASLGAAIVAAGPAWGQTLSANDRINVAPIGIGSRCTDHRDLLLKHRENKRDIEVVALCDV
jgi:hypothetical protein